MRFLTPGHFPKGQRVGLEWSDLSSLLETASHGKLRLGFVKARFLENPGRDFDRLPPAVVERSIAIRI